MIRVDEFYIGNNRYEIQGTNTRLDGEVINTAFRDDRLIMIVPTPLGVFEFENSLELNERGNYILHFIRDITNEPGIQWEHATI